MGRLVTFFFHIRKEMQDVKRILIIWVSFKEKLVLQILKPKLLVKANIDFFAFTLINTPAYTGKQLC